MDLVPNREIREAVLRSGVSLFDIAAFCGWLKPDGKPDTTKITRLLGLAYCTDNRVGAAKYKRENMSVTNALAIIKAINLDPVDFRDSGL